MSLAMIFTLAAGLVGARAAAQGTFEGMVTYKVTTPEGKNMQLRYYQSGLKMRQEMDVEGHSTASITDGATGDMITLIPQRKQYMIINMKQAGAALAPMADAMGGGRRNNEAPDFSKVKVTATGRHETIAGISCEHYIFESTDGSGKPMDMCAATGMGFMGSGAQTMSLMPSTAAMLSAQNPELARLARQGFFVLKFTMQSDNGQTMAMEATAVDRRHPDPSLFQPPADYTPLTIPTMPGMPKLPRRP